MDPLHDRIAKALGWSARDVRSMSMQTLRDLVRPVNPALAEEMSLVIRSGDYIRGSRRGRRAHATTKGPYRVGSESFESYLRAVATASRAGDRVFEVRADGTEIQRWAPPPPAKKKQVKHVLRNPDGSLTPFGKIRR